MKSSAKTKFDAMVFLLQNSTLEPNKLLDFPNFVKIYKNLNHKFLEGFAKTFMVYFLIKKIFCLKAIMLLRTKILFHRLK